MCACCWPGLPDEHGRGQILTIHTAQMRKNDKLAPDVNLPELATKTKNFSGAEIEGLVRAATATAMNRLIKVRDEGLVRAATAMNRLIKVRDQRLSQGSHHHPAMNRLIKVRDRRLRQGSHRHCHE